MSNTAAAPTRLKTVELVYIAVCAALMAVCSWISIPAIPPLPPFTLQTFGVFLILLLLGGRRGLYAVLTHLLLGAVGLPVFSHFNGGAGVLLGTTGGYLLGFALTAALYWAAEGLFERLPMLRLVTLVAGLAVCYAFGTAWFMLVYARQSGAVGLGTALGWCVVPFIVPDLVKLALAWGLAATLRRHVHL